MAFQPTMYGAIYFGGAAVGAAAAALSWRRRRAPGGVWLLLMVLAATWWCFFIGMEVSSAGIPEHVFWVQVSYVGSMTVCAFFLLFTLEYTGRRLPPWAVALLFVGPATGIVGAATNGLHHLIWAGFTAVPDRLNVVVYSHGWLYWVVILLNYSMAFVGSVVMVGFALRAEATYRLQSATVLLAVAIPWATEILHDAAPGVFPGIDPSITFAVSGALLVVGIEYFGLLDLAPVARDKLVESMEDGLIVLDSESRVLDSNPAAGQMLGTTRKYQVGTSVVEALSGWPQAAHFLVRAACQDAETTITSPAGRAISLSVVPLEDVRGVCSGSLVTLRDITAHRETEAALQAVNADLHARIREIETLHEELREQAIRDPLTGLYNRRYLSETLAREIGRAQREGYPVALVMIDVDRFKTVNDHHGHAAGDQVMRFLGAQFRAETRPGDIACRYGGDEFLMVLPNTSVETAYARAEQWRAAVKESSVYWMEWTDSTTLSLGVAEFPQHGMSSEEVMMAADNAVYEAKRAGRDRTMIAGDHRAGVELETNGA